MLLVMLLVVLVKFLGIFLRLRLRSIAFVGFLGLLVFLDNTLCINGISSYITF